MENNEIRIEPPEGMEVDQENSTFKLIKFKKKNELPAAWNELRELKGYFIDKYSAVKVYEGIVDEQNINIFPTREMAEAANALAQLMQLRQVYNGGDFKPDPQDAAHCVYIDRKDKIGVNSFNHYQHPLSFKTMALAIKFMSHEAIRELIKKASPLL